MDQILGKQGSKSKDAYASKISLASRVVKVERQVISYIHTVYWKALFYYNFTFYFIYVCAQVADIEEKLDILFKAYMEDRQRFQSLPLNPQVSKHSNNNHLPNYGHCGLNNNSNNNNQAVEWQNRTAKSNDAIAVTTSLDASTTTAGLCPPQGTNEYTKVCPKHIKCNVNKILLTKLFVFLVFRYLFISLISRYSTGSCLSTA